MILLTPEIQRRLPSIIDHYRNGDPDPMVHAKLFTPDSNWTWFIIAFNPASQRCFGYVIGLEAEFGEFSLEDLEDIPGPFGLPIERDRFFRPARLSGVLAEARRQGVPGLTN